MGSALKQRWRSLTRSTLAAKPPDSFLADNESVPAEGTVLESVMPAFFSIPQSLLRQVISAFPETRLGQLAAIADKHDDQVVVVRCSRRILYDVFYQLLDNVVKHGVVSTAKISVDVTSTGDSCLMKITLKDRQRPNDKMGSLSGMAFVRSASELEGFKVQETIPQLAGGAYEVSLVFSAALIVQPRP